MPLTFFPHAPDNPAVGTPAYAQSILRVNYQYFLTGLMHVQVTPQQHFVLLIAEGSLVAVYQLEGSDCRLIDESTFTRLWTQGEARIRTVSLPREGVRLIREILDWLPSAQLQSLPGSQLEARLQALPVSPHPLLLFASWERGEAYLPVFQGKLIQAEAVFSTPQGVEAGSGVVWNILHNIESPCQLEVYTGLPGTPSYALRELRSAQAAWIREALGRYQKLVGRSLSAALTTDLNNQMRSRSIFIKLIGDGISDTHVFLTSQAAAQAYQLLIQSIAAHAAKVIGSNLTQNLLHESYNRLQERDKAALSAASLAPLERVKIG